MDVKYILEKYQHTHYLHKNSSKTSQGTPIFIAHISWVYHALYIHKDEKEIQPYGFSVENFTFPHFSYKNIDK